MLSLLILNTFWYSYEEKNLIDNVENNKEYLEDQRNLEILWFTFRNSYLIEANDDDGEEQGYTYA